MQIFLYAICLEEEFNYKIPKGVIVNCTKEGKLKIAELEALIAKNQQILTNSDAELQAEEDRIAGTKSSFDQALQSIINQIDHDTQLIEANL